MTARKSYFFGEDGHKLFAIHFQGTPGNPVAILCQPYGDEAVKARRIFFNTAKEWASTGIDVLLFDYYGTGNSQGDFEQLRWTGMLEDVRRAIDEACRLTAKNQVVLVGLRLGATASAVVAEKDNRVRSLVLWSPVIKGLPYLQKALRANLATQMVIYRKVIHSTKQLQKKIQEGELIDINGFVLTKKFLDELSDVNLLDIITQYKETCTIVQISSQSDVKISSEYNDLKDIYIANGVSCDLRLAEEKPFWTDLKVFYQRASNMLCETAFNFKK